MFRLKGHVSVVILCLASLVLVNGVFAQGRKVRVLFVGNSLTSANDLPRMVADLARSRHVNSECEMYAPGGYTFAQHAADPALKGKINQGNWDFVVLQEQSQMPALPQPQVVTLVYPYAQQLCDLIRKANPRARPVFYMTMAKRNGDSQNDSGHIQQLTYEDMQRRINGSYTVMAQHNGGLLAPVGIAWERVRSGNKLMDLYADDKHPNFLGTYLAACVIYAVIFKDNPVGLSHPSQVDNGTASYLQKVAAESVR